MKDKLEAMELKPNMYVRTNDGYISNVNNINDKNIYNNNFLKLGIIKKSSYDIIDLIEVGDYVNGLKVTLINEPSMANCYKRIVYAENREGYLIETFTEQDIKSIVTHEQMEQMAYKVGD